MDIFTLFAANAVVLAVMAAGFFAASHKQPDDTYWRSWIAANLALMTALLLFMTFPAEAGHANIIPHCLLVLGFGWRWRAACQFTGERTSWKPVWLPVVGTIVLFAFPTLFSAGFVYLAVNIILTVQTAAIALHYWRKSAAKTSSSYGLIAAYAIMSLSFGSRIGQGVAYLDEFTAYLPHDLMLQIHLLAALVHVAASGAFAFSIAYERAEAQLHRVALRDPLTGLANRRGLNAHLSDLLSNHQGARFSVIIFDLDHFKAVNDRYGHATGDETLRNCARIFADTVLEPNFVARIGGEEFAAVVVERPPKAAYALADHIRTQFAGQDFSTTQERVELSLSAGIADGIIGELDFDTIFREADANLYRAKMRGRNRVVRSHPYDTLDEVCSSILEPADWPRLVAAHSAVQ